MTAAVAPRDLTAGEARDCIVRIKDSLAVAWDWVIRAYTGRAWIALGYPSWDALCDQEFDGARIRLPREERREVVATLREAGMSTRAIASATGVADQTVRADLKSQVRDFTQVTGIDGKSYAASPPLRPVPVEPETVDAEIVDEPPAPPVRQLPAEFTGWVAGQIAEDRSEDSPLPAPSTQDSKPRRKPLTDTARSAGWELAKAVERVERITADDRFPRNVEQVAPLLRGHLLNAVKALSEVLDQLPHT